MKVTSTADEVVLESMEIIRVNKDGMRVRGTDVGDLRALEIIRRVERNNQASDEVVAKMRDLILFDGESPPP